MESLDYTAAIEKMLAEQSSRDKDSQVEMNVHSLSENEREWVVEQPLVRHHRPRGSAAAAGYVKGQIETVGRGSRHMSHPNDNEKVPIKI